MAGALVRPFFFYTLLPMVYADDMKQAVVVYPHQLFTQSPALAAAGGDCEVYLVEEPLILTHNPIHRQKLMLHKLSMDAYERFLIEIIVRSIVN